MQKRNPKVCFLDTSSLVKLYYTKEDDGQMRDKITRNGIDKTYLSEISKVEFTSAILKKLRQGKITEEEANKLIENFKKDEKKYIWQIVNSEIIYDAEKLIQKYSSISLKSLDAIQLASAMATDDKNKNSSNFSVSHDNILCNLFGQEGLQPL